MYNKLNAINIFIKLYLDYINNFLTLECFANYYGIEINEAEIIINLGKKYNEQITINYK